MSGQILFLCSSIIACSISALCKRVLILQAIMFLHENRVWPSDTITKQLYTHPVILVNGYIVVFIFLSIQIMKRMIISLSLQGQHLVSRAIKDINDQIIITAFWWIKHWQMLCTMCNSTLGWQHILLCRVIIAFSNTFSPLRTE